MNYDVARELGDLILLYVALVTGFCTITVIVFIEMAKREVLARLDKEKEKNHE